MLKLVISLAKSLALIVIVGRKSASARPLGTWSRFFICRVVTPPNRAWSPLVRMRRKPPLVLDVLVDQAGEDLFGLAQLAAGVEPLLVGEPLFDHLLAAGLHGEIRLGERDRVLRRVGILGDEVAGVAGEGDSRDTLRDVFAADVVDFIDRQEMVVGRVAGQLAGHDRLVDHLLEIGPADVAEHLLQVAGQPELGAGGGLLVDELFERGVQLGDEFAFHGIGSGRRADQGHASPFRNSIRERRIGKCLYR